MIKNTKVYNSNICSTRVLNDKKLELLLLIAKEQVLDVLLRDSMRAQNQLSFCRLAKFGHVHTKKN